MDKFITSEYCKRHHKFPTKTDFMEFVKGSPMVYSEMKKMDSSISEFKSAKLEELDEILESPKVSKSMCVYLSSVKDRQKERIDKKKGKEKDILKESMREIILQEIEQERKEKLEKKCKDVFLEYLPLDPLLCDRFMVSLSTDLDDSQLDDLKKLKVDFDKLFKQSEKLYKKLSCFEETL